MEKLHIVVDNFQRIKHADLEIEGITCVVGPSQAGKSALYRAIDACLYNRAGDEFINHDADKTTVLIETHGSTDEFKVKWEKSRGKSATYTLGEDDVRKNSGVTHLDDVVKHGLAPFSTRRDSHKLNLWKQKDQFLVHLTSTRVFDAISELMSTQDLTPVLVQMKADATQLRKVMSGAEMSLETERLRVTELITATAEYDCIDEGDPNLAKLTARVSRFSQAQTALEAYYLATSEASSLELKYQATARLTKGLTKFLTLMKPRFTKWQETQKALFLFNKAKETATNLATAWTQLQIEISPVDVTIKTLKESIEKYKAIEAAQRFIDSAARCEAIEQKLSRGYSNITVLSQAAALRQRLELVVATDKAVTACTKASNLISELDAKALVLKANIKSSEDVIRKQKLLLAEFDAAQGICPNCGAPTVDGHYKNTGGN